MRSTGSMLNRALLTLALLGVSTTVPLTQAGPDWWQDADRDYYRLNTDNCPNVYNPEQLDFDQDGIGDACDVTTFMIGNQGHATITLSVWSGSPPQSLTVAQISNRTPNAVGWTASGSSGLLGVPNSGTVPQGADGTVVVGYSTVGRTPGVYTDTVTVNVGPQTFTSSVTITILAPPPPRTAPTVKAPRTDAARAGGSASAITVTNCMFTVFLDRIELVGTILDGGPDLEMQLYDDVEWNEMTWSQAWPYGQAGWYALMNQGTVEPGLVIMSQYLPKGESVDMLVTTELYDYDGGGAPRGYVGTDDIAAQFTCTSAGAWVEQSWETIIPVGGTATLYVTTRAMWR